MAKLRVKSIRLENGLTQKQLADKLGISQNFLSDIENNKIDIKLSMVEKLFLALNVLPCELIEDDSKKCTLYKENIKGLE